MTICVGQNNWIMSSPHWKLINVGGVRDGFKRIVCKLLEDCRCQAKKVRDPKPMKALWIFMRCIITGDIQHAKHKNEV